MNRRALLVRAAFLAAAIAGRSRAAAQASAPAFVYPIALPGRPPGDGFFLRHGFAVENTWFAPGNLHTGEDWYAVEGDTAGAAVIAIGDGEVVYADSDYPGRVVIVQHAPDLFSMYGHLDYALPVAPGQTVARGDVLGAVLARSDEFPSHLHFEVRTFLTTAEVNGDAPRYGFACGPGCAPGPGYWPIGAPDLPADQGWLNPTHVIARRGAPPAAASGDTAVVVAAAPPASTAAVRSDPTLDAARIGTLPLDPGTRFPLLDVRVGAEAARETGAVAYEVWYRLRLADGGDGWVQAAVPSDFETGSDGRPSTVRFALYPDVDR